MKYTAITIGPIYRCMQMAKSSKALWSASYLFSYIMREIYENIKKQNGEDCIICPRAEQYKADYRYKAGLFPDRLIFEGEIKNFDDIKDNLLAKLADTVSKDLGENEYKVLDYLKNFLVINKVEKELESNARIVKEMNDLLDTSELFQKTNSFSGEDYLKDFFELKESGYNQFIKNEFEGEPFPPINEIATTGLEHNISGEDEDFYRQLEKSCKDFQDCHKYIAIVQADGDNFGQFISGLKDKKAIQDVSDCLFEFSEKVVEEIKKEKGLPIYAGGDDLLFFMPVITKDKNVLDIVKNIDKIFETHFLKNEKISRLIPKENKPSMSYGINISYYKYPLDQALGNAQELLFGEAKNTEGKNAIALRITKHSGRVIETVFSKNKPNIFNKVKEILNLSEAGDNFINGFMHKLSTLSSVIENIAVIEDESTRNSRFDALFKNFFDEDIHQKERVFLDKVKEFISEIYTENQVNQQNKEDRNKENLDLLYTILRFYQFIERKPHKK